MFLTDIWVLLKVLNLSYNSLSGLISQELCSLSNTHISVRNNSKLSCYESHCWFSIINENFFISDRFDDLKHCDGDDDDDNYMNNNNNYVGNNNDDNSNNNNDNYNNNNNNKNNDNNDNNNNINNDNNTNDNNNENYNNTNNDN